MNLHTMNECRHAVSGCLKQARDALFNMVDALSSETAAHSFPEWSLSPLFQRTWASADEAFEDGSISNEQWRDVCVQFAPLPGKGQRVFLGVDTSNVFRSDAQTEADRTLLPLPNVPERAHVVCPGWVISSVVVLPEEAGQGTVVLDTQRVTSSGLATEVAANQVLAVVELLVKRGLPPVIIGDRWDACAPFLVRMSDVAARCLLRVKAHRVFDRPAPKRQPGQRGARRQDGARFPCSDPTTPGNPDACFEGTDPSGKRVEVRWWNQLHVRTARLVEVRVIQVIRHGASDRPRDPKVSWCVWKGDEPAPLAEISPTYRVRSSHEHGFRLDKQALRWDKPRLRTPSQTERWTQIVACAQPVGSGASSGGRDLSALGGTPIGSDPGAGSSSHAYLFDAVGHPGTTTAPTRKSAGTCQGVPSEACPASSSSSQDKQKGEKAQNSSLDLSLLDVCFSCDSSFFALSPNDMAQPGSYESKRQ